MQKAGISILPRSSPGRWSVGLAVASIVFFALSEVLTGFEVLGAGNTHALATALTVILAAISGGALAAGVISLTKSGERSVLVFLAVAVGLYSLVSAIVSLLGLPK